MYVSIYRVKRHLNIIIYYAIGFIFQRTTRILQNDLPEKTGNKKIIYCSCLSAFDHGLTIVNSDDILSIFASVKGGTRFEMKTVSNKMNTMCD